MEPSCAAVCHSETEQAQLNRLADGRVRPKSSRMKRVARFPDRGPSDDSSRSQTAEALEAARCGLLTHFFDYYLRRQLPLVGR